MSKTSNPVLKDGLGIVARLVVIAMLLGVLSTMLQGCSRPETASLKKMEHQHLIVLADEQLNMAGVQVRG